MMDLMKDKNILGHIARKRRVICALVVALAAFATSIAAFVQEGRRSICKRKQGEIPFYKRIIYSNEIDCHDQIRMSRGAFFHLATILREKGSITNTVHLTLEEQLVMFLHTLGHNLRNRKIAHNFGHSGETISRYFHKVLIAILALHGDYLLPPGPTTPPEISGKDRFDPYFKDCVGAIDGTHIPATVDVDIQAPYRDRKGNLSQNVMGVSSFDYKFQYILAGWEGSAADSRVLASALSRSDPLVVPPGFMALRVMSNHDCPCGAGPCILKVSRTKKNPGRQFWSCSKSKKGNDGCRYFKWVDEVYSTTAHNEGNEWKMCKTREVATTGIASTTKSEMYPEGQKCKMCEAREAELIFLRCLLCVIIGLLFGLLFWNLMQQ